MTTENNTLKTKYEAVYRALVATYGEPTWQPHNPPVDELVCTILSQATSDTNLIRHGRETCLARNPHCHRCSISIYCDYYQNQMANFTQKTAV